MDGIVRKRAYFALFLKRDCIGDSRTHQRRESYVGKYKFFEINVRLGRSNFYVTGSGFNTVKWIVDDYISDKLDDYTVADNINLYSVVPKGVIMKYVPESDFKDLARKLFKEGKVTYPLLYKADKNLKHNFYARAALLNQYRKFKKYF